MDKAEQSTLKAGQSADQASARLQKKHDQAVDLLLFVAYITCMGLAGFLLGIRDILKR